MKNSFTPSIEECTYFTNVSAEVLLVAECFVYFRVGLGTGKRPEAEKERWAETGGLPGPQRLFFLLCSEPQSAPQYS